MTASTPLSNARTTLRGNTTLFLPLLQYALPMLIIEWLYASARLPEKSASLIRTAVYSLAFYLFVFHGEVSESFIYFQF